MRGGLHVIISGLIATPIADELTTPDNRQSSHTAGNGDGQ